MRPYEIEIMALTADVGVDMPVPEFRFAKPRLWRFDWAWPSRQVALEIEGGFFGGGKRCPVCGQYPRKGHASVSRLKSDCDKYSFAAVLGWTVIRRWPDVLLGDTTRGLLGYAMGMTDAEALGDSMRLKKNPRRRSPCRVQTPGGRG